MKGWGGGWPEKDDRGAAAGPVGGQDNLGRTSLDQGHLSGDFYL